MKTSKITSRSELLYPPVCWSVNHESDNHGCGKKQGECPSCEVPYDLYHDTVAKKKVGDLLCHSVSAPGYGHVTYRITQIDETGVYAEVVENTSGIFDPDDVI